MKTLQPLSEKGCKELSNCRTADASAEQMTQHERHDFEGMGALLGFSGSRLQVLVGATREMSSPIKGKRAFGLGATAHCHRWRSAGDEGMACSPPRRWLASAGSSGCNFPRIHLKKLDFGDVALV